MKRYVDAFHAKTHLSELLRETEQGYSFTIRRRGKPVAHLIPVEKEPQADLGELIAELNEIRKRVSKRPGKKLRIRDLINQGRRI